MKKKAPTENQIKKKKCLLQKLKVVDKTGFNEYFGYKPSALVSKLMSQNAQIYKRIWTKLNNKRLNQTKMNVIVEIKRMKMTDLI